MSEVQILQETYQDRVSVYRKVHEVDGNIGETREREKLIYDEKPCALSQSKAGAPVRNGATSAVDQDYVIFTDPSVRILDNDRVTVVTEAGERYEGRTGRTFVYARSHGETKLKVEGTA